MGTPLCRFGGGRRWLAFQGTGELNEGRKWTGLFRNRRKNGELYWDQATLSPVRGPDSAIRYIVATQADVTEQRQAEEALRLSETRFALAQQAAHIGSWDWDLIAGSLHWSGTIERMFGLAPGTFPDTYQAFLGCVHPDDRPAVEAAVRASLEQGEEYALEHRILLPDGSVRRVAEKGDVVRDAGGKPLRMLGVVHELPGEG